MCPACAGAAAHMHARRRLRRPWPPSAGNGPRLQAAGQASLRTSALASRACSTCRYGVHVRPATSVVVPRSCAGKHLLGALWDITEACVELMVGGWLLVPEHWQRLQHVVQ